MLNKAILMGRLTRDPELRYTPANVPVCSFTVAIDRSYQKNREQKQADFINVVAWRTTAEFVSKYFTKGSMIVVSGRLQIRDWTDRDGGKRRSAEINVDNVYFGESRRRDDASNQRDAWDDGNRGGGTYQGPSAYDTPDSFSEIDDDDGELPF